MYRYGCDDCSHEELLHLGDWPVAQVAVASSLPEFSGAAPAGGVAAGVEPDLGVVVETDRARVDLGGLRVITVEL